MLNNADTFTVDFDNVAGVLTLALATYRRPYRNAGTEVIWINPAPLERVPAWRFHTLLAVSFVFNGQAVRFGLNLRLIAEPASVVFTAPDVQFVVMHPLHWVMQAETCNLNFSAGWLQMRIYQQPGFYNLGSKVYVPRKR